MIRNISQYIYDETGKLIDEITSIIKLRNNYTNTIQIVAPFPVETSIMITYRIKGFDEKFHLDVLRPYLDPEGNIYKGEDVIDNSKDYAPNTADWNVWELNMRKAVLAELISSDTRQIEFKIKFGTVVKDSEAVHFKGTFGTRSSTTKGDLPITATGGDYYKLITPIYYSERIEGKLTYGDLAVYDGGWFKGSRTEVVTETNYRRLPVERYQEGEFTGEDLDLSQSLINDINTIAGRISEKINEAPNDNVYYARANKSWRVLDTELGLEILNSLNVNGDNEEILVVFEDLFDIDGGDA